MFLELKLKFNRFFRKYKYTIVVIGMAFLIVFFINQFLKSYDFNATPSTTYTPEIAIMGEEKAIPNKYIDSFNKIIDDYMSACNNHEYEKVYAMLDENCKTDMFPTIEHVKTFVDAWFATKKIYTVQNYYDNKTGYTLRLRIFDDILATGLTGESELAYSTDLVTIDTSKKDWKICINGYISREPLNKVYEDNNMKITIIDVKKEYETETYRIRVTNRTENIIVLLDNQVAGNEISLRLDAEDRRLTKASNMQIAIGAYGTNEYELVFNKYYHEADTTRGLWFNTVRVVKSMPISYDENGDPQNAIAAYGVRIEL